MKTYVLDASALFAYLQKRPGALKMNELLKETLRGRARLLMSAINYGEVYGKLSRDYGVEQALTTISAIRALPVTLLEATPQRAMMAADIKNKYRLYYVDSFAAGLAGEYKATLVTSDSDFRKLGHGFSVLWLRT